MSEVKTINLIRSLSLSAGDSWTSGPTDLRDRVNRGAFSLAHSIAAGTSTTCGTTIFSYIGCTEVGGTYISPSVLGTFGTSGPAIEGKITAFSPAVTPFMKIIAQQTGSGTAGANSKVTADLNFQ